MARDRGQGVRTVGFEPWIARRPRRLRRTAFGKYLRRSDVLSGVAGPLDTADALTIVGQMLDRLERVGTLTAVDEDQNGVRGYRLKASSIRWVAGDGTRGTETESRCDANSTSRPLRESTLSSLETSTLAPGGSSVGLHGTPTHRPRRPRLSASSEKRSSERVACRCSSVHPRWNWA